MTLELVTDDAHILRELVRAGASKFWLEAARTVDRERARLVRCLSEARPARYRRVMAQQRRALGRIGALDLACRSELARLQAEAERKRGDRLQHVAGGRW